MKTMTVRSSEEKLKTLKEWKKQYIEAIIDSLKPSGSFLEIGFASGEAAEHAKKFHPKKHTIIETNPETLEHAKKWAGKNPGTTVISGKWEQALGKLEKFDAIFFNDYPKNEDSGMIHFLFPEEAIHASGEAKKILGQLEKEMAHFNKQFSDHDIEEFYEKIGKFKPNELPDFFHKMQVKGNITKAQHDKFMKKYQVKGSAESNAEPEAMLKCLKACLKSHMNKGAHFTAFLDPQGSKYEQPQFYDAIITNPDVNYEETSVSIKTSDKTREALVISVQKIN